VQLLSSGQLDTQRLDQTVGQDGDQVLGISHANLALAQGFLFNQL
jgi:hypothetical protein